MEVNSIKPGYWLLTGWAGLYNKNPVLQTEVSPAAAEDWTEPGPVDSHADSSVLGVRVRAMVTCRMWPPTSILWIIVFSSPGFYGNFNVFECLIL